MITKRQHFDNATAKYLYQLLPLKQHDSIWVLLYHNHQIFIQEIHVRHTWFSHGRTSSITEWNHSPLRLHPSSNIATAVSHLIYTWISAGIWILRHWWNRLPSIRFRFTFPLTTSFPSVRDCFAPKRSAVPLVIPCVSKEGVCGTVKLNHTRNTKVNQLKSLRAGRCTNMRGYRWARG